MAIERTLSIIKPDAVRRNLIGEINRRLEASGLSIVASKMHQLSREQTERFYGEHEGKAFFPALVELMSSGPVVLQVLEGEGAIATNRRLMGATDPTKADAGTIRGDLAKSVDSNLVHGSDSSTSAQREITLFFNSREIYPR